MAAVELTRMDFHVSRFMNSDDAEEMDACEIGQFCLLLFKAWLIAKDVTLPVEEEKLARYARVPQVSAIVLRQFPIVDSEWGQRRQNGPQYAVWLEAKARSEAGKIGAANRWQKQSQSESDTSVDATALPEKCDRSTTAVLVALPRPDQTIPQQNRTNHPIPEMGGHVAECSATKTLGDWKTLAVRHKRLFGTQASTTMKDKYAAACQQYGEAVVLDCFEDWAKDAKDWVSNSGIKQPLFAFFKKLPEMAPTAQAVAEEIVQEKQAVEHAAEKEQQRQEAITASVEKQDAEMYAFMAAEPPPENGGSVYDYYPPEESDHSPAAEEWRAAQEKK